MEGGEDNKPWKVNCSVVAMDTTSFCYRACSVCERTLPETGGFDDPRCVSCYAINPSTSRPKRFYRILLSIATESKVMVVICFDKAARVLFGCSADELFEFAKVNPFAVATAGKVLEGEMMRMTLSKPMGGAQHVRAVSIVPLRTGFKLIPPLPSPLPPPLLPASAEVVMTNYNSTLYKGNLHNNACL